MGVFTFNFILSPGIKRVPPPPPPTSDRKVDKWRCVEKRGNGPGRKRGAFPGHGEEKEEVSS